MVIQTLGIKCQIDHYLQSDILFINILELVIDDSELFLLLACGLSEILYWDTESRLGSTFKINKKGYN